MKRINLLFVGRFQPFHLGHWDIIKKYYLKGFFIKIGIGSSEKAHEKENPFTFNERMKMVQLVMKKQGIRHYSIFALPDFKGSDLKWKRNVRKIVGDFDFLVTGNSWVRKNFHDESIGVFSYDENKMRHKGLNGKDIRNDLINGKRKGIPLVVYNYLKKINGIKRLRKV